MDTQKRFYYFFLRILFITSKKIIATAALLQDGDAYLSTELGRMVYVDSVRPAHNVGRVGMNSR